MTKISLTILPNTVSVLPFPYSNILVIKYYIFIDILLYMVYKNIQSLASGETKDIIIHIGPILYTPRERNPCT